MRTLIFSTLALALLAAPALPLAAEHVGLQPDTPYGLFGEESGAYLGIDTRDVTSDRLAALKLKEERGVEITMVDQDAPAGKAGLREHDVILSFNGEPVESVEQLRRMIHETPPGRTVSLGVSRDGQMLNVKAQLADRRKMFNAPGMAVIAGTPVAPGVPPNFEMPPMPPIADVDIPSIDVIVHSSVRGGLMVENLTSQLGDFFGVKNGQGVLVRSVEKGSVAERAGFHAGDIIVRVGKEPISDTSDWRHAMRLHRSGAVPVGIVRDRRAMTISFVLPKETGKALLVEPEVVAHVDMNALREQMKTLGPEMERARQQFMEAQKQFGLHNQEIQKQVQQAMRQAQREMASHQHEIQEQAQRAAEQARREWQLHRKDIEKAFEQMKKMQQKANEM